MAIYALTAEGYCSCFPINCLHIEYLLSINYRRLAVIYLTLSKHGRIITYIFEKCRTLYIFEEVRCCTIP